MYSFLFFSAKIMTKKHRLFRSKTPSQLALYQPTASQIAELALLKKERDQLLNKGRSLTDVALPALVALMLARVINHSLMLFYSDLEPFSEPGTDYFNSYLEAKEIFNQINTEERVLESEWVQRMIDLGASYTDTSILSKLSAPEVAELVATNLQRFEEDPCFRQFLFKNDLMFNLSHYTRLFRTIGVYYFFNKFVLEPSINEWGAQAILPQEETPYTEEKAGEVIKSFQKYNKSLHSKVRNQTILNSLCMVFLLCLSEELGLIFLLAAALTALTDIFENLHTQSDTKEVKKERGDGKNVKLSALKTILFKAQEPISSDAQQAQGQRLSMNSEAEL